MQIPFLSTATHKLGVACVSGKCRKENNISVPQGPCIMRFLLYHVKLDHHWHKEFQLFWNCINVNIFSYSFKYISSMNTFILKKYIA